MRIVWTKLTGERHAFEVIRDDGSRDRAELETRSLLLHDLVHYAVEAEAGLQHAFYGKLAAGTELAELGAGPFPPDDTELALAEALTGPMQSVFRGHTTRERYVEQLGPRFPGSSPRSSWARCSSGYGISTANGARRRSVPRCNEPGRRIEERPLRDGSESRSRPSGKRSGPFPSRGSRPGSSKTNRT